MLGIGLTSIKFNDSYRSRGQIALPYLVDDGLIEEVVDRQFKRR
jgi:hypothetical protein